MCGLNGCTVGQYHTRATWGRPNISESAFVLLLKIMIGCAAVGFGYDGNGIGGGSVESGIKSVTWLIKLGFDCLPDSDPRCQVGQLRVLPPILF